MQPGEYLLPVIHNYKHIERPNLILTGWAVLFLYARLNSRIIQGFMRHEMRKQVSRLPAMTRGIIICDKVSVTLPIW